MVLQAAFSVLLYRYSGETDIVMGRRLGLATVLVLSGVTRPDDPRIAELRPDLVLPSVRALLG